MTNKLILFVFLTILFLLSRPLRAQAQQTQQSNDSGVRHYVIEQRYVQRLVWKGDEYTLKYEVVIEQNENGKYKAYIQEFTEKPSLIVSLPTGKYRYRIIPYDYLEQPGEASEWVNIEIKPSPTVSADEPVITEGDKPEDLLNLYISAAWSPFIPLYGRMQEIFENKFYAIGAFIRFGALYNGLQWFSPGVELSMSWYALNNSQRGDMIGIQTGVTGLNIVAQKELPFPKMAVALRTGFALAYQVSEINVEDYSYTTGGLIPQINIEASFLWFVYKQLYVEAGIGFTQLIDKDNHSGCLRPWIGAGWKF